MPTAIAAPSPPGSGSGAAPRRYRLLLCAVIVAGGLGYAAERATGPGPIASQRPPTAATPAVVPSPTGPNVVASRVDVADVSGVGIERNADLLASGSGSIWALVAGGVIRLEPTSGAVIAHIHVRAPIDIAYGQNTIWTVSLIDPSGAIPDVGGYLVSEISPASNGVIRQVVLPSNGPIYPSGAIATITVGDGLVFVSGRTNGCEALDIASGTLVTALSQSARCGNSAPMVAEDNLLWVADHSGLVALDPWSGQQVTEDALPHDFAVRSLLFADGALWAAGNIIPGSPKSDVGTEGALAELDPVSGVLLKEFNDGAIVVCADGPTLWAVGWNNAWSATGTNGFYGEIWIEHFDTTTDSTLRRVAAPGVGSQFWFDAAASDGHLYFLGSGPSASLYAIGG